MQHINTLKKQKQYNYTVKNKDKHWSKVELSVQNSTILDL